MGKTAPAFTTGPLVVVGRLEAVRQPQRTASSSAARRDRVHGAEVDPAVGRTYAKREVGAVGEVLAAPASCRNFR